RRRSFSSILHLAAGEGNDRPGSGEGLGGPGCLALIHLVGRTQAGKLRARRLKGRNHVGLAFEAVVRQSLDAAGLVEILAEGGPRGEIGQLAEVCKKNFWPRSGFGKDAV